jgi:hypothetical protein
MKFEMDFSEIEEFAKRLSDDEMFYEMLKDIVEQMVKDFHSILLMNTPVGETWELYEGWEDVSDVVSNITKVRGGYSVEIVNTCEYAAYVNDGHYSYNQYNVGTGRPWVVKDENRTVVYKQGNHSKTFVYGHFFVEDSIEEYSGSRTSIRNAIKRELEDWWRWCSSG